MHAPSVTHLVKDVFILGGACDTSNTRKSVLSCPPQTTPVDVDDASGHRTLEMKTGKVISNVGVSVCVCVCVGGGGGGGVLVDWGDI